MKLFTQFISRRAWISIPFLLLPALLFSQTLTITGQVSDEDGFTLPGVNIYEKETNNGTISDLDGNYSIEVESGTTIVFSFIGYSSQEFVVTSEDAINVVLLPDAVLVDEIVVTGYGQTQNRRLVPTSISTLSPTVFEDRPITRVEQAIQGSAPAIVVIQESGSPGAGQTIRMRGVSTAGNSAPLILVNGVQVPDMNFINPNDVKNITILKDAASSAIYGARGGNGVIQVETKNGGGTLSKPTVTFNSYYGIQSLASEGDYLNAQEYAEYYNESSLYQIREGETPNGRPRFTEEEIAQLPNTVWIREVSDDARIGDYHLGFSGNGEKMNYYAGVGFFDQVGIIGNSSFNRFSGTLGIQSEVSDRMDISFFATYSKNNRKFIAENNFNSRVLSSVAALPPIFPARDSLGNPFNNGDQTGVTVNGVNLNPQPEFGNPLLGLDNSENRSVDDVLYANSTLSYKIIDRLKFTAALGYMTRDGRSKSFNRRFEYPNSTFVNPVNSLFESTSSNSFLQGEGYFTIDASKSDAFSLDIILGSSFLQNDAFSTSRRGENFYLNTFEEVNFSNIINQEDEQLFGDVAVLNRTLSYYSRANLAFRDKYLLSATIRADASSKFSASNRWGYFPSVAAGWLLSSEDFLSGIDAIDLLKFRASWGVNGNDQIDPYQYAKRFVNTEGNLTRLDANPDVKWEEISQFNVGLDANLFENKIGLTLDYYIKNTSDMLLDFPVPGFLGIPAPIRNAASVRNSGIEAVLLFRNRLSKDFDFEIGLNFGASQNEVTDLNGGQPIQSANLRSFANSPNISLTDVGYPIASFYGFIFDGVDDAGNATYRDLNGDGLIDQDNDRAVVGNPFPDFIYGVNLRLNYRKFDLSAFIYGSQGNDVVNSAILYSVIFGNRAHKFVDNAWTHENPDTDVLRPSATEVVNNEFSDYYIEDGSFVRLKNITLGYTFPNFAGLQNGRVFVSANNWITLTGYSGLDPEIGANNDPLNIGIDQGFYPQAKTILFGLNLTF